MIGNIAPYARGEGASRLQADPAMCRRPLPVTGTGVAIGVQEEVNQEAASSD